MSEYLLMPSFALDLFILLTLKEMAISVMGNVNSTCPIITFRNGVSMCISCPMDRVFWRVDVIQINLPTRTD
jgi:hypothetical protein